MSLDKSITNGKEHRKPYRGAKAIAKSCCNHGCCGWCRRNRTHKNDKREMKSNYDLKEWENEMHNKEIYSENV